MPKVGMEPIRRRQLIDATMMSIDELGYAGTTLNSISRIAGVSTGIIAHYFGNKNSLLEATMHHLLLCLRQELGQSLKALPEHAHIERIKSFIHVRFSPAQISSSIAKTWLVFWVQALHDEALKRLQIVNEKRLISNLSVEFKHLVPVDKAKQCARSLVALIDGFWLQVVLSSKGLMPSVAIQECENFLHWTVQEYGANDIETRRFY